MKLDSLFLTFNEFRPSDGITKKIQAQYEAFLHLGYEMALGYIFNDNGHLYYKIGECCVEDYGNNIILSHVQVHLKYKNILKFILLNNIKYLYIRSTHFASPWSIAFFRDLRKKGITIIMEIPTYPYDGEYKNVSFFSKLSFTVDKLCRKYLAKYINYIATFSDDKEIWSCPTINISNAVDFSSIPLTNNILLNDKKINCIGVAGLQPWHGFDRFILGIHEYVSNNNIKNIIFHIVGGNENNATYKYLKSLVHKYNLYDYVYFYGELHGFELDSLFQKADVAIGSLGRHRSNILKMKSLKNREYAARGIPFVYSEIDDDFDKCNYTMRVPADDSPINIKMIIEWRRSLTVTPSYIRASVIENLSWDYQMSLISEKFKL